MRERVAKIGLPWTPIRLKTFVAQLIQGEEESIVETMAALRDAKANLISERTPPSTAR